MSPCFPYLLLYTLAPYLSDPPARGLVPPLRAACNAGMAGTPHLPQPAVAQRKAPARASAAAMGTPDDSRCPSTSPHTRNAAPGPVPCSPPPASIVPLPSTS